MSERVIVDRPAAGVLRVTLTQPARRNALDHRAWCALDRVIDALRGEASAEGRCLLVQGADAAFCAGGDINEYETLADRPDFAVEYLDLYSQLFRKLRELPIPTLAAIDGPAVGAGLALAAGCDFRLATPRARFAVTAVKRGLVYPIEEIARLAWLSGMSFARDVILRGTVVDATQALRCSLVDELVEPDALAARALALASRLAQDADGTTFAVTKHLFGRIEAGEPRETEATRRLALAAFGDERFREETRNFLATKDH